MKYGALVVPVVGVLAVLTGFLVYGNLNNNLVYYLTPAEAVVKKSDFPDGERFRLGGLVKEGSVQRGRGEVRFTVTGGGARVRVVNQGAPAQLFRAGVGVVVEGAWRGDTFYSDTMIVKHDSEYRPPSSPTDKPSLAGVGP